MSFLSVSCSFFSWIFIPLFQRRKLFSKRSCSYNLVLLKVVAKMNVLIMFPFCLFIFYSQYHHCYVWVRGKLLALCCQRRLCRLTSFMFQISTVCFSLPGHFLFVSPLSSLRVIALLYYAVFTEAARLLYYPSSSEWMAMDSLFIHQVSEMASHSVLLYSRWLTWKTMAQDKYVFNVWNQCHGACFCTFFKSV